jgi:hypothetical protein
MKTVKGLLLRGGILIAVLVAVTLFINLSWFDEPLHPDLVALRMPQAVSMDDNAYPLVYGFAAANDRDPRAAGLAMVARLRERYQQGAEIGLDAAELAEILGPPNLDDGWQAEFASISCNSRLALDCAGLLIADVGQADLSQPRLRLLLERYQSILRTSHFEENQEYDVTTPVPPYGPLMQIGRVRLAISMERDSVPVFLGKAAEDLRFWKTMLREGQTLVAKMVALAGIRNDLTFLSALLQARDLSADELDALQRVVQPLTPEELDIGETFLSELRIALQSSKALYISQGDTPWLSRLIMQDRATTNESYQKIFVPLRLRASLSSTEFYRQRGNEPITYALRAFPPALFNLGGKMELEAMLTDSGLQDYVTRTHDLNGRILLVLLQAEIERSPARSVAEIVRSSSYRNPYTEEPMDYDAQAQTIGFDCLTSSAVDVCRVEL